MILHLSLLVTMCLSVMFVCLVGWGFLGWGTGMTTQNLLFDDGVIMINYTQGETCHKVYERSTAILFSCDHSKNPVRFTLSKFISYC